LAFAVALMSLALPVRADVTDEQVVDAMKKGIDFLLKSKKGDNWETGPLSEQHPHIGGHTAIAVYALLHAGDSLQDVPEYRAKLNWRGGEVGPAVKWLSKFESDSTYVAGLQASALALCPKLPDEKLSEGVHFGMEACRMYLLGSAGPQGGYTYEGRVPGKFAETWKAYFEAAVRGNRKGSERSALDKMVSDLYNTFGGPELELQKLMVDLRERSKSSKDSKEIARLDVEIKELVRYSQEMPKSEVPGKIAMWKARIASNEAQIKQTGKTAALEGAIAEDKGYIADAQMHIFGDNSNGQYGILGVWALSDWGMEIPNKYWENLDAFWRRMQKADGSFVYWSAGAPDGDGSPAMGVAGIASLFICQEFVDTELRLTPKPDKPIDAGLAWLNKQFTGDGDSYYLYGVERVGLASGLKFFGTKNWYKEGAERIIKGQGQDGSFGGGSYGPTVNTSYALLFLARGRNPVVFNKLEYKGPWNARARDDAYVTRWISKRYEKPVNWQSVNLQVSTDEWLDAPILLITGSVDPKFTKEDVAKLRQFVNAGGMIFSTADGNSQAFTTAMRKYAGEVVNKKYEMRQLTRGHDLFSRELGVDLPNPPALIGLSNGVRELWIHSTQDVGADWQMRKFSTKSFELGAALYFYASGNGSLRSKLQPLAVAPGTDATTQNITVARIDYAGNADPEPEAWARLAKLAKAQYKTDVKVETVKFADLDAKKYPLATLTGTTKVTFTDEDAGRLRTYLDNGGLLFADAAAGNAEFAESCRDLFNRVYPDSHLEPLPPDSPIYTGSMPEGVKIDSVEFRRFGELKLQRKVRSPSLQAINVQDKLKVLFSAWDISSGFLGTNTWGVIGYAASTSEKLGRNIVLYAINPAAATMPATAPAEPK